MPAWNHYTVEKTFPARAPYQPMLPVNLASIAVEKAQRFRMPVSFSAHHIYRLHRVNVTWDGAVFHNLRLFIPSIVYSHMASRFQDTLLLRQWVGERVAAPCIAVCHDQWSVENYYHWLIDTLPRLLLLRQTYPDILLLLPQPLPPKQLPDYISRSAAVMGFTHYLPLHTRQILQAENLVLPELTAPSLTQNPELVQQVRAELVAALTPGSVTATRKVFAARSAKGVRSLVNEPEVYALLQEFGFERVYFEQLSFLEQVSLMRETSVFLGVHGAGMTNMLFLQEGAKVVELLNEEHGDLCYFRLASCLGLPYYFVPCAATNHELANQSNITLDIDMLQQVISQIM
jgi:capsular polysaccharide biosynthesis protein